VAGAAALFGLTLASLAHGVPPARLSSTAELPELPLTVGIDDSCVGFGFDQTRLEQDVYSELEGATSVEVHLSVRCTEELHVQVTERVDGATLEQRLDLSTMPPSAWQRALVLAWAEGVSALRARSSSDAAAAAPSQPSESKNTRPAASAVRSASIRPKSQTPLEGEDAGDQAEPVFVSEGDFWVLAGGAARVFPNGGLAGGNLSLRYRPLLVGATVMAGSRAAMLSTAFVGWSLLESRPSRVSPLLALRASAGVLSRQRDGLTRGGGAYVDGGLWFGATFRMAYEWALLAALDAGYARPTTAKDDAGSTTYGGPFAGIVVSLGAHPQGMSHLTLAH
jgi:hypothetical protein